MKGHRYIPTQLESTIKHLSRQVNLIISVTAVMIYSVLFFALYRYLMNGIVSGLALAPALIIGWLYGKRVGLLSGILLSVWNTLLFVLVGASALKLTLFGPGLLGSLFLMGIGGMAGWVSDLHQRIREQARLLALEISERKRIEQVLSASEAVLRQSKENYRNLLEVSPAANVISAIKEDGSLPLVYANSKAIELLGAQDLDELLGRTPREFMASPTDQELSDERASAYLAGGNPGSTELTLCGLNGKKVDALTESIKVEYDGQAALLTVMSDISERKRAEEALRHSEERLRAFAGALPDRVVILDANGNYRDILNQQQNTAVPYADMRTKNVNAIKGLHQEVKAFFMQKIGETLKANQLQVFEYQVTINDVITLLEGRTIPIQDPHTGEPLVIWIARDITGRKQAEEALRKSEETALAFQDKLRKLHEITLELSQENNLDDFYRQAIELGRTQLGFDRLGLWVIDEEQDVLRGTYGTDETGQIRDERHIAHPISGGRIGSSYGFELIRNKKRIHIREGTTLRGNEYQPIGEGWNAIAILWDGNEGLGWVTADNLLSQTAPRPYEADLLSAYSTALGYLMTQKHAATQLRQLVDRLTLLSQIDHAILRSESTEAIAQSILNPLQQLAQSDYVSVVIVDQKLNLLVRIAHTDLSDELSSISLDKLPDNLIQTLEQGQTQIVSPIPQPPNLETKYHLFEHGIKSCAIIPMNTSEGLVGLLVLGSYQFAGINNVQAASAEQVAAQLSVALQQASLYQQVQEHAEQLEQKVAERTHQLQEKADEMEAFTYSVSHDLRAPLRAINGFSNLLLEDYVNDLSEKAQHYLNRIQTNSRRMGQLIEDLLALARIGRKALHTKSVDTKVLVKSLIAELEADGQIGKAVIHVADLPPCEADAALLKQVYFNLISNAVKYSREADAPTIEVGYTTHDNLITYFVKDNGIGFDMQYVDKLFGVFQRLHNAEAYEGTGVGLATVWRIISRHGGRVWVEAAVNQGATFFFTLA